MNTMLRTVPLRSKKLLWLGSWPSFDSWRESSQKPAITASGSRKTIDLLTGHLPFRQNNRVAGIIVHCSLYPLLGDFRTAMTANGHRQVFLARALHENVAHIAFERD